MTLSKETREVIIGGISCIALVAVLMLTLQLIHGRASRFRLNVYDNNHVVIKTYKCKSIIMHQNSVQCNTMEDEAVSVHDNYYLEVW